jgi:hypothetical protein
MNRDFILALATCELPKEPLKTIGPIDQVEMAYTNQSAFVIAPATGLDTIEVLSWY